MTIEKKPPLVIYHADCFDGFTSAWVWRHFHGENCSEHVGGLLLEHPDREFAAGYFRRRDGRWQFSLRSREDFDVSAVARTFGGGGHAGAAGFDVANLEDVFGL